METEQDKGQVVTAEQLAEYMAQPVARGEDGVFPPYSLTTQLASDPMERLAQLNIMGYCVKMEIKRMERQFPRTT